MRERVCVRYQTALWSPGPLSCSRYLQTHYSLYFSGLNESMLSYWEQRQSDASRTAAARGMKAL